MAAPVSDQLAEQITTALEQVRAAREQREYDRERVWSSMLDRLLDRYSQGLR